MSVAIITGLNGLQYLIIDVDLNIVIINLRDMERRDELIYKVL